MMSLKNLIRRMVLARALKSAEPKDREAALEELGEIGNSADIRLIATAFKDNDPRVRKAAAQALLRIGDPRAVAPLIEGLSDSARGGAWQVEVLGALEHFQDPRAVSACMDALQSHDAKVRRAAASALGTLGAVAAVPKLLEVVLDEDTETSREAGYALAKIGTPALEGLTQIMREAPVSAKITAATALGIIGDQTSIPVLVSALKDRDSYLQIAVANALARFNDPAVVAPLIGALEESSSSAFNYGVREEASTALLKMGPAVIEPLLEALQTASSRSRLFIIKLLGELPDPRSFLPLANLLRDSDTEVRKAILGVLMKVDRNRAIELLPSLLDDPDFNVCHLAGEALFQAGWQATTARDRARLAIALGRYPQALNEGEEGIQLLLNRLKDTEPTARRQVAEALGSLKDSRFLPCFQAAIAVEPVADVQQALMEAMEGCGPAAVGILVALLESGDWGVRRRVSQSLLKIGWQPQAMRTFLICALAMGNVDAIAAVGAPAHDLVRQALREGDSQVKSVAAAVLQKMQLKS
jgi:HEAT repeat protein